MRAVRYDNYGGVDVLEVRDVEDPVAEPGGVVVRVKAASINPGEAALREGAMAERWPSTFPSGQGSDFAGVVEAVGDGVDGFAPGDEVFGFTHERAAHAELVSAPEDHVVAKPAGLAWEVAGSIFVGPLAGYASVDAVDPQPGESVVVSGAAGGVGGTAAQLAVLRGARVIGLASEANHEWLRSRGVVPVAYGEGQAERIRAALDGAAPDAFVDAFGGGYVDLALELGVAKERINTVIDFAAAQEHGVKAEGSSQIVSPAVLAEVGDLAASGDLEIPIEQTYPLDDVRQAYVDLAARHIRGKRVLIP